MTQLHVLQDEVQACRRCKPNKTPRLRLYTVRIGFVNPNADYEKPVYATSMWNAVWKVTDSLQPHERAWGGVTHVNGRDVLSLR